ncbi:MAG: hypothetical protein KF693_14120 [Nitrospira sp.]|nr:hypothetical protein [Nitrospira sp.]
MTTLASGIVRTFDHEYALAGVTVIAYLPAGFPDLPGAALSEPLKIGQAESATDGSFELTMGDDSPGLPYACYLEHCNAPGIQLCCYDMDGALLVETEVMPIAQLQGITLRLNQTDWLPGVVDWQSVGRLMQQAQMMTLDQLAAELTSLSPMGIFKGWAMYVRLGYLYGLENALLDPDGMLSQAGVPVRISQVQNFETRAALRQQIVNLDHPDLVQVFDNAVVRADLAGGHLLVADVLFDSGKLGEGDVRAAVSRFFGNTEPLLQGQYFDVFPWLQSPLVGYRDYLVDIWVKRATRQIKEQTLDGNGAVQQLNNRFHQNFRTTATAEQPANRLAADLLVRILKAPVGAGFGFGVAAASIQPQGEMTNREFLDYLIALTGETRQELENRYRLNLSRSDLETSNPVQQNIETLQRFFTDSFQSLFDPYPILPPLAGNGLTIINANTYPGQEHSPFFWQYEEWLERNEPFWGENYFDIRRVFKVSMTDEESRKAIWGRTMSLAQFLALSLNSGELSGFTPPKTPSYKYTATAELKIGDQWARNLIELQDWVNDAHKDFFAGFFTEAERKYVALIKNLHHLNTIVGRWKGTAWDKYNPAAAAAEQRAFKVTDPETLEKFEQQHHLFVGYWLSGNVGEGWLSDTSVARVPYLIDMLMNRLLPACLSETRLALGKFRETVQGGTVPIATNHPFSETFETSLATLGQLAVFTGATPVEPGAKVTPPEEVWWTPKHKPNTGSLPFATETDAAVQTRMKTNPQLFPANDVEKKWFRLKLGNALLEWADLLYRTDKPENMNRARELYKGVLFLHGEDPEIAPAWGEWQWWKFKPMGVVTYKSNPQLTAQVNRAHIGFDQINAGLNFYGFPKDYVPPVRYRVMQEAALSFAASAKSAQTDYLNYMTKYEQAMLDEMTARNMVEKASYAIQIADEQVQIAQFSVGEAQKQVEGVKAQIAAKLKEIKDSESFFTQLGDFFSGMKDAAKGLGEGVLGSMKEGNEEAAGGSVDWGAMYKVISAKGGTGASAAGLTGSMAVTAGFGAFIYAGVTSMQSLEAASNKRFAELKGLREVALPAAEKLVELKKREVKIAGLHRSIAQADYDFGKKLLTFYDYRFLSKAFWQQMSGFANRLMRRYLDLGGRTAWFAERALSFEADKDIRVVSFDYFPRHLRGVTGADTLQLHLAELEATRIYGLSQTVPVKQTISLSRDFPIAFGQLKKHGACWFATSETPLRLAYPGVYGYRIRCVSIGATYADDAFPHKGMLSNNGFSMVTRSNGSSHRLLRYPDALPLSEFNMRGDMLVYDLPDETLLPFEGSGIETAWELSLSRLGDATSLENLTDVLLTFDMRANYSAALDAKHKAELPASLKKSVLISGRAQNFGEVSRFKKDGDVLKLTFRPVLAAKNSTEKMRTVTFLALVLSGVEYSPVKASLTAETDGVSAVFDLTDGIALSNAGFLATANGGVALPLNDLTGISADQRFTLTIDAGANAGADFSKMYDVQLMVEYEAQI